MLIRHTCQLFLCDRKSQRLISISIRKLIGFFPFLNFFQVRQQPQNGHHFLHNLALFVPSFYHNLNNIESERPATCSNKIISAPGSATKPLKFRGTLEAFTLKIRYGNFTIAVETQVLRRGDIALTAQSYLLSLSAVPDAFSLSSSTRKSDDLICLFVSAAFSISS